VHRSMNIVHFFRNMVLGEVQGHSHTRFNNCPYCISKILKVYWEFICSFYNLLLHGAVIPEELTDSQLAKEFSAFYST
jgi:hypothetical protein